MFFLGVGCLGFGGLGFRVFGGLQGLRSKGKILGLGFSDFRAFGFGGGGGGVRWFRAFWILVCRVW